MSTFNFLFGTIVGECILKHMDNLSRTLQNPKLTAVDAHSIAKLTCKTLDKIRNGNSFDLFWEKPLQNQQKLGLNMPSLPRKRKAPEKFRMVQENHFFMILQRIITKLNILKHLI